MFAADACLTQKEGSSDSGRNERNIQMKILEEISVSGFELGELITPDDTQNFKRRQTLSCM